MGQGGRHATNRGDLDLDLVGEPLVLEFDDPQAAVGQVADHQHITKAIRPRHDMNPDRHDLDPGQPADGVDVVAQRLGEQ